MSFFGIFKGGFAFNRMAKSYKEIFDCFGMYNFSHDIRHIHKATWIYYYCILGSLEKWNWKPSSKIAIPDYHMFGRIPIHDVNIIVTEKITRITQELMTNERTIIENIMKGYYIKDVESLIHQSLKEKLLP